jgi:D-3-phosphoglycerate dehydrogenase / 2-oxoglutarate reductase
MQTVPKSAFYVETLMSPEFERVLLEQKGVALHRLHLDEADRSSAVLAGALGYQISAARDETPAHWMGSAALLARTPDLLVVSSNGAGYDTIDVPACTAAGVLAVHQAGGNREGVAEHVLAFMLTLTKRIGETDRYMRRQANIPRTQFKGHDLVGRTIGIVGLGNVGKRVAELCRGLFRMRVVSCDPYLSAEDIAAHGAEKVTLDELMAKADYVSVNCPLTNESRGMIGARQFALMQPHAYFINTARGFIHDEAALAQALADKRIAGAGLDVWDKEPPAPDHPLLAFDNVLASPHTAGVTFESRDNIARIAAEQMLAIFAGEKPERLINPEVWPLYRERYRRITGMQAQD